MRKRSRLEEDMLLIFGKAKKAGLIESVNAEGISDSIYLSIIFTEKGSQIAMSLYRFGRRDDERISNLHCPHSKIITDSSSTR